MQVENKDLYGMLLCIQFKESVMYVSLSCHEACRVLDAYEKTGILSMEGGDFKPESVKTYMGLKKVSVSGDFPEGKEGIENDTGQKVSKS